MCNWIDKHSNHQTFKIHHIGIFTSAYLANQGIRLMDRNWCDANLHSSHRIPSTLSRVPTCMYSVVAYFVHVGTVASSALTRLASGWPGLVWWLLCRLSQPNQTLSPPPQPTVLAATTIYARRDAHWFISSDKRVSGPMPGLPQSRNQITKLLLSSFESRE
jgi:hypothetical protein